MWRPTTKRRKVILATSVAFALFGMLYFWLPYRVAVVKLFFRLGGSRALMAMEYRSLDLPRYVPAADAMQYPNDAEVLVFESRDTAKAIPLKRMAWHLIINDEIDGKPIAATFCTMSNSALVYRAVCGGKTLHFSPNRLADNNLVMRDAETGSLWQQFSGEAIEGPLAGARLERVAARRLPLAQWREQRPKGVVLEPANSDSDTTAPNDTCPVMCYFSDEPFLLQSPRHEDSRLPRKHVVVGAILPDGKAVAWPAADKADFATVPASQQVKCYWFAWTTFHPDTSLLVSPVNSDADKLESTQHGRSR
jgi:hypothetical protein